MKQYSWTLMTPGSPPVVGLGDVDEIEHSLSLMTLPGLSSPKALIDHLQKNEDANGAADFSPRLRYDRSVELCLDPIFD